MPQPVDAPAGPAWSGDTWDEYLRDVTVSGRRVHFLDVGDGPVLLLVHGLGASWQVWYRNIAELSADHRVVAVDLPGFGFSEALSRPAGIRGFADALAGLLDLLDVEEAVVVAHSLGGLIAQNLATRYPERVAGLLLVSSADGVVDIRQAVKFRGMAMVSSLLNLFGRSAFLFTPAVATMLSVPQLRRRVIGQVVHEPELVPADLAVLMIVSILRSPALADAINAGLHAGIVGDLKSISCPTVVVTGQRDRVVPVAVGRRLAEAIPDARYEPWTDVGHHPMLERPADFSALVRRLSDDVRGIGTQP